MLDIALAHISSPPSLHPGQRLPIGAGKFAWQDDSASDPFDGARLPDRGEEFPSWIAELQPDRPQEGSHQLALGHGQIGLLGKRRSALISASSQSAEGTRSHDQKTLISRKAPSW